jgi:hypothetical protein
MIRHIVLFKFKPETTPAEREQFIADMRQLADKVEVVQRLEVGLNFTDSPRACDIALTVDFADKDALQVYADHPNHLPVKQRAGELCSATYVVDYEN